MSKLNNKIKEIFKNNKYNAHGVSLSKKIKNGKQTEELSITFDVLKKKDINSLTEEEKIPSHININGQAYETDVVESAPFKAMTCYDPGASPISQEILKTRTVSITNSTFSSHLRGGQQILMYPDNYTASYLATNNLNNQGYASGDPTGAVGTLGFLAIDNEDDKVVGITNAHVVCGVLSQNDDRDMTVERTDPYNFVDSRSYTHNSNTFTGIQQGVLWLRETTTDTYSIRRLHHNSATQQIKRASFYDLDNDNTVDAAVLSMENVLFSTTSYRFYQPTGTTDITSYFTFATTTELDNLLTSPPSRVYSVGRTTGPKGWGSTSACQLEVSAIDVSQSVGFTERGSDISAPFDDLIRYKYVDNSNFPVAGGDSGSALFADMDGNGTYKIIGLVFAGNGGDIDDPNSGTHTGLACRIDNVASIMNIRAWSSTETPDFSQSTITEETVDFDTDSSPEDLSRTINSATYWNAGLRITP